MAAATPGSPSAWRRRVLVLDALLAIAEVAVIGAPLLAASGDVARAPSSPQVLGAAFLILTWLRLAASLRAPAALAASASAGAAGAEALAAARLALRRAPGEVAALRSLAWAAWAAVVVLPAWWRGEISAAIAVGTFNEAVLLALAAGALRGLIVDRVLAAPRALVSTGVDGQIDLARGALFRIRALAVVATGLGAGALALLAPAEAGGALRGGALWLVPLLVAAGWLWLGSLARRARPLRDYFDLLRDAGTGPGPARDDPRAVAAFAATQSLPYRLASYHAVWFAIAAVIAVAAARSALPDAATAARVLGALALVGLAGWLLQVLALRRILRPLARYIGSRHRVPLAEVRAPVSLRVKLHVVFAGSALLIGGGVALAASGGGAPAWRPVAFVLLAVATIAALVVDDLVAPVAALAGRSEDMARGELARPVPPSGEVDEIGRLAVAFEEMRRSLRDRLRSTESINVDLEREVRRRTEVLERRNVELQEAMEKLRRAQDQLIRSEKLASMGRLVAGIAQEIDDPVNAVLRSLGALDDALRAVITARGGAAPEARAAQDLLAAVERDAARAKTIVRALHDYSRPDATSPTEVSVARSVDAALELLRHATQRVRVDKDVDAGAVVKGFAGQLEQVFLSLLSNAVQAMGDGGGVVRIRARRRGDEIEIEIADDGPGIAPDVLPRIFDPFFTTKDGGRGVGLGLSVARGIVERHGGRIAAASGADRGATFTIALPQARRAGEDASGRPGATA